MLTVRKGFQQRGMEGYTGPRQGRGAEQRVHGGGWPCADLHYACQSPHWGHGRGGEGGGHQGRNSSSQRCCRPSCPVACRLWTLTGASGHPTEQQTYINMSTIGGPSQHTVSKYVWSSKTLNFSCGLLNIPSHDKGDFCQSTNLSNCFTTE